MSSPPPPTTMEINGVSNFRHHQIPSSSHFHSLFTFSTITTTATDISADELTEADLFADSSDSTLSPVTRRNKNNNLGFSRIDKSGILAALPDDCGNRFSTPIRAIPKPPHQRLDSELTQSVPCRKFHQSSAPVNMPKKVIKTTKKTKKKKTKKNSKKLLESNESSSEDEDDEEDEEMLPPHEIVAIKLKSTSSVLEGVGRTLKGRDLRQVRNAVWRQTGFLD